MNVALPPFFLILCLGGGIKQKEGEKTGRATLLQLVTALFLNGSVIHLDTSLVAFTAEPQYHPLLLSSAILWHIDFPPTKVNQTINESIQAQNFSICTHGAFYV